MPDRPLTTRELLEHAAFNACSAGLWAEMHDTIDQMSDSALQDIINNPEIMEAQYESMINDEAKHTFVNS